MDDALQLANEVLAKYPDQPDKPSVRLARALLECKQEIEQLAMSPGLPTYLITIQDKSLYGEPDIAIAVVRAADEAEARSAADVTIDELANKGRGRCVPHARTIDLGKFYRLGALVRLPHDPNKEDT